jgi:GNAT superfamily N-acetyltransferase/predicted transcriptional regulator
VTAQTQVTIEEIDETSPHLKTVIALGDANKKTLGFFTEGAFRESARDRVILIALNPQKNCIGYLLYRPVRRSNIIVIVHLCVDPAYRGRGVTKQLVNSLSQKTQNFYGIQLKCRRDYGIDRMWETLGFIPLNDRPGRSKEGKLLTVWWLDHGHPTIFSQAAAQQLESKICAVIDTSIFLELHGNEDIESAESDSLLADWLQDDLELCVTDEIFKAINALSDSHLRNRKRLLADTFTKIRCEQQLQEIKFNSLRRLISSLNFDEINDSLFRQLAQALAADCLIFLTHDPKILALADAVYENFSLAIITPTDLIIKLDDVRRDTHYQPVRFVGIQNLNIQLIDNKFNKLLLTNCFHAVDMGEKIANFQLNLRQIIANPDKFKCYVVLEGENQPLALIAYRKQKTHELEVTMLRVRRGVLAAALARYLLFHSISVSVKENRQFTRLTDQYFDEIVIQAIQEDAFVRVNDGYLKANPPVAETAANLSQKLANLAKIGEEYNFCMKIAETLNTPELIQDLGTMAELERRLWPAKIIDADLPTFMIPIQPRWAKDLFDEELAKQYIFGSQIELALKRELVYYRSNWANGDLRPGVIGRILWYVSSNSSFTLGTKEVKACSRLEEVIIDKPEKLYRQFRSLGVYELKDLMTIAKDEPKADIMAIRFSHTELFPNPLTLKRIQGILGNKTTVQRVFRLPETKFGIIYKEGTAT